ncbi:unnamed protein product [Mesocestoides corti]|uniref:diacylglycerol O-acyltransferase n=2 Tax=Mesocestoides corti TaxID=53468 RepID=A0A158QTS9_MESCO|nr:unnamed protein product [Mesocestoides corti]
MGEVVGWYDHSVLYRFRARFAVFLFGCSIVILPFVCFGAYVSLFLYPLFQMTFGQPIADMYSCFCFLVILIYTVYWIWDIDTPYRGGRRIKWLRNLPLWKWVADYFAARLIVSEELCTWAKENGYEVGENLELVKLPTSVNYLVGYHPHGPLAIGALMAYGSDSLNFSKVFPGIKPHMATLNGHYDVPFYRDYALFGGALVTLQCLSFDSKATMTSPLSKMARQSIFRYLRSLIAILLLEMSFLIQPALCAFLYTYMFLCPLMRIILGQAIVGGGGLGGFIMGLIYTAYWISTRRWPTRGGIYCRWFTRLPIFRWAMNYFPSRLVVSDELREWAASQGRVFTKAGRVAVRLPTAFNYLVGYHPHGWLALGAVESFGNDALEFSETFPGIQPHMAVLNLLFNIPIHRDYIMLGGGVSVSRESLIYLLDKELTGVTGNLVAVSVGGATEALESRPGHYVLMLSRRRGFFRIALKTGAHLIPSLGFGETNMYDQVANPVGSVLRRVQDWFTHTFTFSPPIFYSWRVIPYRKPLNVVVGKPIVCKRTPSPTDEEIDNLREQYKQQLTDMFFKYRPLYDPTAEDIRFY